MKTLALVCASLVLLASSAAAQGGYDLRWDHCSSGGGTINKTIDCNDPGAVDVLVVTAKPGVALSNVVAFDVWIDIIAGQGALPALWQSQCSLYQTNFSASPCPLAFATQVSVTDACGGYPWQGDPGRSRLHVSGFRTTTGAVTLAANTEYTLFELNLDHGAIEACVDGIADCNKRVSFGVQRVELEVQSGSSLVLDTPLRSYLAVATGPGPEPVEPPGAAESIAIVAIAPNPTEGSATISYGLPRAGRVSLAIYDLRGRRLRQLVDEDVPAGIHTTHWDGGLDHGGRVKSGTYFAQLGFGGVTQSKRVIIVR